MQNYLKFISTLFLFSITVTLFAQAEQTPADEPAPATEEAAQATEQPAPAAEQPAPASEQPAPAAEEPAPAAEQPAPAAEEPAPAQQPEPARPEPDYEEEKRPEQFYFDQPKVEDREVEVEMEAAKKAASEKMRYRSESSTSQLPYGYFALPETAYGSGLMLGGSSSNESAHFIEGVKVPFTHHLLSGKPVINQNLLAEPYFFTGAFGVELSDSTGGVTDIKFRPIRSDSIGGMFDLSMYGASLFVEGPLAKHKGGFSASVEADTTDLFTRLAYRKKHSVVSSGGINGHIRYLQEVDASNSFAISVVGVQDSLYYLSKVSNGAPNLSKSLSPETIFFLIKADFDHKTERLNSRFSANFVLSNYDYKFFKKDTLTTIDNRAAIEEHLSWKFSKNHALDFGVTLAGGLFTTDTSYILLPLEGETGAAKNVENFKSGNDSGYFQPSLYIKYRLNMSGVEFVPGVNLSGNLNHSGTFRWAADPRLFMAFTLAKPAKLYISGGLYSKRPQYEIATESLGSKGLGYENSAHARLGFALNGNGFFGDFAGFYKYFYNLIRRSRSAIKDYENGGKGWAAGAEARIGYADKSVSVWASYTFLRSRRTDFEDSAERKADGDIPHIFKAAFSYNLIRRINISGNLAVASGILLSEFSATEQLADNGIYLPVVAPENINSMRLSNSISYSLRFEYLFFAEKIRLGLYADAKGSKSDVDILWNSDFSQSAKLHLVPILGTIGIRGEF